ncbi:hypothetical protein HK101_012009 [Irineochytrium annulatum]|nr:hypothetical protein HK101_012009 [Irineochytrium annulatum]
MDAGVSLFDISPVRSSSSSISEGRSDESAMAPLDPLSIEPLEPLEDFEEDVEDEHFNTSEQQRGVMHRIKDEPIDLLTTLATLPDLPSSPIAPAAEPLSTQKLPALIQPRKRRRKTSPSEEKDQQAQGPPRLFKCSFEGCDGDFTCLGHLIRHERIHTGTFTRADTATKHSRGHIRKLKLAGQPCPFNETDELDVYIVPPSPKPTKTSRLLPPTAAPPSNAITDTASAPTAKRPKLANRRARNAPTQPPATINSALRAFERLASSDPSKSLSPAQRLPSPASAGLPTPATASNPDAKWISVMNALSAGEPLPATAAAAPPASALPPHLLSHPPMYDPATGAVMYDPAMYPPQYMYMHPGHPAAQPYMYPAHPYSHPQPHPHHPHPHAAQPQAYMTDDGAVVGYYLHPSYDYATAPPPLQHWGYPGAVPSPYYPAPPTISAATAAAAAAAATTTPSPPQMPRPSLLATPAPSAPSTPRGVRDSVAAVVEASERIRKERCRVEQGAWLMSPPMEMSQSAAGKREREGVEKVLFGEGV